MSDIMDKMGYLNIKAVAEATIEADEKAGVLMLVTKEEMNAFTGDDMPIYICKGASHE